MKVIDLWLKRRTKRFVVFLGLAQLLVNGKANECAIIAYFGKPLIS
jgi:hypothetical protein